MQQTARARGNGWRARLTGGARRRQIIEAAAVLFSHKGFRGTTTREITRAVGVSEAMLFKHFATKGQLYSAVIKAKSHGGRVIGAAVAAAERNDDALVLRTLVGTMIGESRADPTVMRLMLFSALEGHALSRRMVCAHVRNLEDFLRRYIAKRVAAGALRHIDARRAARSFVGMVAYALQMRELFKQSPPKHVTSARTIHEMVALFLDGVRRI